MAAMYTCVHCVDSPMTLKDFKIHVKDLHGNYKHDCKNPLCLNVFNTKDALVDHEAVVHGIEVQPEVLYTCFYCSKQFTRNALKVHSSIHTKLTVECCGCFNWFKAPDIFKKHKRFCANRR